MKHSIIYKNKNRYSSFPLLTKLNDRIQIGFFTAPVPDHMGLFNWNVFESFDNGETWEETFMSHYNLPSASSREKTDRFVYPLDNKIFTTGSAGFSIGLEYESSGLGKPKTKKRIRKHRELFIKTFSNIGKVIGQRFYEIPGVNIVLTFPRALNFNNIILIPAYALFPQYDMSRCFVWRSEDWGKTFRLWNMFPGEIDGNEMAFIKTKHGILAHIRSDKHSYLMQSWSQDEGITWTYPTNVYFEEKEKRGNIIGGPPHLLRLNNGKILCSYGYRKTEKMGIRAIISGDEGETWNKLIVLRDDGGYRSSLHKRKLRNKFKLAHAGNDVGYPVSIQLSDESILTAYYITTRDQITGIETTKWNE